MKKKIKILLVGLGAEIGSTLINLTKSGNENFEISGIITNEIVKNDLKQNFQSVIARIILNDPSSLNRISFDEKKSILIIGKKKINVYWGDIKKINLSRIKNKFDVTIIATSKIHINNKNLMKRFLKLSKYVFGVAESTVLPSIYPNLININSSLFQKKPLNFYKIKEKVFALGSCQTNGWQAQLRLIAEIFNEINVDNLTMLGCELDIVHPDTAQGRLGTKSLDPREQDARNNLRPGFSQVEKSMKKIFNKAHTKNTISLRTLTTPPGYQISRFYLSYSTKNSKQISKNQIKKKIKDFCQKNKFKIQYTESSLGSRAFERLETSAIILLDDKYFHLNNDFLNLRVSGKNIVQIIFQSYVHNTRGYSRSVIEAVKEIYIRAINKKNINCWK